MSDNFPRADFWPVSQDSERAEPTGRITSECAVIHTESAGSDMGQFSRSGLRDHNGEEGASPVQFDFVRTKASDQRQQFYLPIGTMERSQIQKPEEGNGSARCEVDPPKISKGAVICRTDANDDPYADNPSAATPRWTDDQI